MEGAGCKDVNQFIAMGVNGSPGVAHTAGKVEAF
jgi:hypothetical protein